MELIAKLKKVNPIVERGDFKTRKVWVTTEFSSQYPQTVEVEIQQDKTELFAAVGVGSEVKLYINLRGREWQPADGELKVFNTLVCWKMEVLNAVGAPAPAQATAPAQGEVESLPF